MNATIIDKLDAFFSKYSEKSFQKNDLLFEPSTTPIGIFYITDGVVRRYFLSENGDEITLNLYKPHTFLPMSWAIADITNTHFYEALTEVQVRLAPKDEVLQFLENNPEIVYDLLRRVYIGMEGLWMHIQSLTAGTSYTKLVASLVILAKRFGIQTNSNILVTLKMSEQDIAKYAGMSRETASRELQKLKTQKIVTFEKGVILIHNMQALEELLLR